MFNSTRAYKCDTTVLTTFNCIAFLHFKAGGIHPDQKDSVKGMKLEQQHETKDNNGGKRNFIHKHQDLPNYWPNAEVPFYVDYNEFGK